MAANDNTPDMEDVGYGASEEGDLDDAPDQVQPETRREPPSDEEQAQDDYANTDEHAENSS